MVPTSNIDLAPALAWSRITVDGPQSEEYLQGQVTQDVQVVGDAGRWTLLLRPDSAVICAGWLARVGDAFTLDVPRSLADVAIARLRRFHLRVNCTLAVEEIASGPYNTTAELLAARWPGPNECAVELSPQSYGAGIVNETVSFTKGCYTGQELVARLDARGASVPWRFVHATGPNVERINDGLRSKGPAGPQGVTTAGEVSGEVEALGFAHRTLLAGDLASAEDVSVDSIE
jgi:folate-binding protein YgfZ